LSGGEKARVALAKTIISKANFLMLDEPTNHLDMHSVDLLADALDKYEGSMILVSHDRYFISKTANKIWEIVDGKIVEFKGGYTEWCEWKERMEKNAVKEQLNKKEAKPEPVVEKKKETTPPPSQAVQGNNAIDKDKQKEKKKLQRQFDELEMKIQGLKKSKADAETALADPAIYSNRTAFAEAESTYNRLQAELISSEKQSETVFEALMNLD
jgi:ATP-binding cassette subfamily F protein 3